MRRWLSEYQPPAVPGSEGPLEVPEAGYFDVFAAEAGRKGDWDRSDLISDPYLSHYASISVSCGQLREVCSTASLSFPTCVVNPICLDVRSVPA